MIPIGVHVFESFPVPESKNIMLCVINCCVIW